MGLDFEAPIEDLEQKINELAVVKDAKPAVATELADLRKKLAAMRKEIYASLTPWQTVQVARHPNRPLLRDFISHLFTDFLELHGDRAFGDDRAICGGFATIGRHRTMVIGHQKGKTVEENLDVNFGMARPEGYRKALRLMRMAEKLHLPVICFIDTPGAYPGADAEERGQAEAIARNLREMSAIETPIVVIVTGEGGSGGALGIGVGDVILMLAHAVYSVISPEGCASILWRDGAKAPEAAAALKITSASLLELGVVDEVIPEPPGGAHANYEDTMSAVNNALVRHLEALKRVPRRKLVTKRFEKYARIGRFAK